MRAGRRKGSDGKEITKKQAESKIQMTAATPKNPIPAPQGDFADFAGRRLGVSGSNNIKAAWRSKKNAGKREGIREDYINTQMGGGEIDGKGVADRADIIKLRAAGTAIRAHIASTKDFNSGLGPEVTKIAEEGFQSMTRSIVNSKTLTNNVGPESLVGKKAESRIASSVKQLFAKDGNK